MWIVATDRDEVFALSRLLFFQFWLKSLEILFSEILMCRNMSVLIFLGLWCFKGWRLMLFRRCLPDSNQLFLQTKTSVDDG